MKLALPESVASAQDLATVVGDMHEYSKWASRELIKQKVAGKSAGTPPEVSTETAAVMRAWANGRQLSQPMLESLLKALDDYKKTAPTITITLAAVPSGDVKTKLVGWCRKEISPTVLVNFRLNRAILGGMVVAYGSHIHDWSFRRKLIEPTKPFHEVLAHV